LSYIITVKSLTIRLPESLVTEIEQESQSRQVSKSDVVRERLRQPQRTTPAPGSMKAVAGDLVGSIRGLPADLSSHKKQYLRELIHAGKHHRG
jgi:Arc/MetJ-type ribon-helix-helix transcriptional regulator